jgi:hypothetical protein
MQELSATTWLMWCKGMVGANLNAWIEVQQAAFGGGCPVEADLDGFGNRSLRSRRALRKSSDYYLYEASIEPGRSALP